MKPRPVTPALTPDAGCEGEPVTPVVGFDQGAILDSEPTAVMPVPVLEELRSVSSRPEAYTEEELSVLVKTAQAVVSANLARARLRR